jgi:hypothetical protein
MYLQPHNENNLALIKTATKSLKTQHLLMTMAIRHYHTYPRWKIVHNFPLEKTPGFHLLSKLRVIHIYEADWGLIQKFFVSHKINKLACNSANVPIDQAGSRPGRSAIAMGTCKVIMYEIIRIQRLSGGVIYNDAKACYDRIIENLSNLALLQHGLQLPIAQLHATRFQQIKYFIKHKLGISSNSHQHNHPAPVFGVGQGACDAPSCWCFICDALIKVYKSLGTDAIILSSITNMLDDLKISAFVGDTALLSIIS